MKILSIPLAIGMSSLGLWSVSQTPASAQRLRDCPGATWESQFSNCKMVDFHAAPPPVEVFEVSMRLSLSVTIAQYQTDFAIAHAPPQRAGLLALQYETDRAPTNVQVSQTP
ncbi:MAG: hypothetical protein AAF773_10650 [Cyanobacteria bacterium P01_D01_bin.115]